MSDRETGGQNDLTAEEREAIAADLDHPGAIGDVARAAAEAEAEAERAPEPTRAPAEEGQREVAAARHPEAEEAPPAPRMTRAVVLHLTADHLADPRLATRPDVPEGVPVFALVIEGVVEVPWPAGVTFAEALRYGLARR